MAVGCMAMIDAVAGGVAYTSDPQDATDRRIRISAAIGLPKTVVDGRFDADLFIVDRDQLHVIQRQIAAKTTAFVLRPGEGITRQEVPEDIADQPGSPMSRPSTIARDRRSDSKTHFGAPQDVEWALPADGQSWSFCRRVPCTHAMSDRGTDHRR